MIQYPGVDPDALGLLRLPLGEAGVNLRAAADALLPTELRTCLNLQRTRAGRWAIRAGQTRLVQVAGSLDVHSIQRLNLTAAGDFTRFWGIGTTLQRGQDSTAGMAIIDTAYSGNPLTLVPLRPDLSGAPWMVVADTAKIRQVSATGLPTTLGQPAPATPVAAVVADIITTGIAAFDSSDGTEAALWSYTAGADRSTPPVASAAPTGADVAGVSGNAVAFTLNPGAAASGYNSIVGRARALNLELLGGSVTAGPDDIVHLWLRLDRPDLVEEVRAYLVCSASFDPAVIPGTSATANTDAFALAARPNDFTDFVEGSEDALTAGAAARQHAVLDDYLAGQPLPLPTTNEPLSTGAAIPGEAVPSASAGSADLPTHVAPQFNPGRSVWSEFGIFGKPLRRSQWARIGSTPLAGWGTITGIVIVVQTTTNQSVTLSCDDWFLTGGYPLDTSEVTATPYDWRCRNYHTLTGDVGNPSPVMAEADFLSCLRQRATITPPAAGDPLVRQQFFRRGGSLPTDWYYVGVNAGDGLPLTDEASDAEAAAGDTLELDNDQPVTTLSAAGATLRAQPLRTLFGPVDGLLFGCGDPNRPGYLYWSKQDRYGSWPPGNAREVCPASEELMAGQMWGGEAFVFSRERMYRITPNFSAGLQVAVQDTPNAAGLAAPWASCVGPDGIYYVSKDGVRRTTGGASEVVSDQLRPLFLGEAVSDANLLPIDWAQPAFIRLCYHQQQLHLLFQDTGGNPHHWVRDQLAGGIWFRWLWSINPKMLASEESTGVSVQGDLLFGARSLSRAYRVAGRNDDGAPIAWQLTTGYLDLGAPRADKELGDVLVSAAIPLTDTLTLQTRLNDGATVNAAQNRASQAAGQRSYLFDPFGSIPQSARTVQLEITGSQALAAATDTEVYFATLNARVIAEQILRRMTVWDPLSKATESYLTGCSMLVDTGDVEIACAVEYTLAGALHQLPAPIVVRANGRRRLQFSWPAVHAEEVRLVPQQTANTYWRPYAFDWIFQAEPARISRWDSNWENKGDSYYTGLDLECDTLGVTKTVQVYVDEQLVTNPATGGTTFPILTSGPQLVHLTFGPARGHLYRFVATDDNPGLLYSHQWMLVAEPGEQANWNQPFTIEGTLGDKAVKAVLIDCDTFGAEKQIAVQVDGTTVHTFAVTQNGRGVQQFSFPQVVGRVLRLLPTDSHPGRLYGRPQWVFDEEPLALSRWETQLIDHGVAGWQIPLRGLFTLRSTTPVQLLMTVYNQEGGVVATRAYTLAATGGVTTKRYVKFLADKGVLFKYVFTSTQGFWLYRPESAVDIQPLGGGAVVVARPFGDDDLDRVRALARATAIAEQV